MVIIGWTPSSKQHLSNSFRCSPLSSLVLYHLLLYDMVLLLLYVFVFYSFIFWYFNMDKHTRLATKMNKNLATFWNQRSWSFRNIAYIGLSACIHLLWDLCGTQLNLQPRTMWNYSIVDVPSVVQSTAPQKKHEL